MKSAVNFPREYFLRYKEKPVKIKPFTKLQKQIGEKFVTKVKNYLSVFDVEVLLRGSTAYGISGKGDVEIGIYPKVGDWDDIIGILKKYFGTIENEEENYVRFNLIYKDTEIELIVLKGREAVVDKKLQEYLLAHPELIKKYEKIKVKYAYSKREYNYQKNKFLRKVEEKIPEV